MTDLQLMIALQRENRDSLGFIPDTTLRDRYGRSGTYLISTHRTAGKIGFLLFGAPRQHEALHIHQTCLQLDYRRRHFAAELVHRLCTIASESGATELRLRCAVDLPANSFWQWIGAELLRTSAPRTPGSRALNHYAIPLDTNPHPLFAQRSPVPWIVSASDFSPQACTSEEPNAGSPLLLPASALITSMSAE